jgi:hypothetical protein
VYLKLVLLDVVYTVHHAPLTMEIIHVISVTLGLFSLMANVFPASLDAMFAVIRI